MDFRLLALCAALMLGASGAARAQTEAQTEAQTAAEAEIRARFEAWASAFNKRDATTLCEIYSDDLVSVWRGSPDSDKVETCARVGAALADAATDLTYSPGIEEVVVAASGDLAVVRVTWTLGTEKAGVVATSQERGMDVLRRESDGAWRILRTVAFSTEPDE